MIDISVVPEKPGVYIFKKKKQVIYIGKAKNLKKRVSSYFFRKTDDIKTLLLVKNIEKVEWIITQNEVEALILENNLIKKHKPKFNIKLADDKTYPYIKINCFEDFPSIKITRKKLNDSSLYFGPYTSALKLKQVINFINKNFKLRKCTDKKFKNRVRPCLYYQINQCMAPCTKKIEKKEYNEIINQVILFLKGDNEKLISNLKDKMFFESNNLNYEKAAYYRDLIKNIEEISQSQITEQSSFLNTDVFHYKKDKDIYHLIVLRYKNGKLIDTNYFYLKENFIVSTNFLEEIIPQFYTSYLKIPDKIVVNDKNINFELLKIFFKRKFSATVNISYSEKKDDLELIKFAEENLLERARLYNLKKSKKFVLQKRLNLKNIPERIDAFDISTFSGKSSVGTRVTFVNGNPEKTLYRKYIVKTVNENVLNDFAMMEEVVGRSCKEYVEKREYPDLILIDGGKGQLNSALKALTYYKLHNKIDIIAIAKNSENIYDKIFIPNRKNYINLEKHKEITLFLMKIRDEVHRFSINFHKNREENKNLKSQLLQIKGVGDKRATELLKYYKSIEHIKKAPLEELYKLNFISKKVAENIYNFFKHQ